MDGYACERYLRRDYDGCKYWMRWAAMINDLDTQ
jgi:hypothetical protein